MQRKGPLLLACNHPNSFLDAIIIGSRFDEPVYFLARGDAFKKPFVRKLLVLLNIIPIYRLSEGREYLALNDATFELCRDILLRRGIVLIFSEGLCLNKWTLRSLKKGTARIAIDAWVQPSIEDEFEVIPVGINYDSFNRFGKSVVIDFGQPIIIEDINTKATEGERISAFNQLLSKKLAEGVMMARDDERTVQLLLANHKLLSNSEDVVRSLKQKQRNLVQESVIGAIKKLKAPPLLALTYLRFIVSLTVTVALFIPGIIGWLIHAPLLLPLRHITRNKTKGTVFFDSVLFGLLLITYPLYWIGINLISLLFIKVFTMQLMLLITPLLALAYLKWRDALARIINYLRLKPVERKQLLAATQ